MIPSIDMMHPMSRLAPGYHPPGLWSTPAYVDDYGDIATDAIWLRADLITRLAIALGALATHELGLLVWDGWRSMALQRALYDDYGTKLRTESGLSGIALTARLRKFVCDPDRTDRDPAHTTGGAVDLTLCDRDGDPLDMGSEFDELSDRSHPGYYDNGPTTGDALYSTRRALLLSAMSEAGFVRLDTEWWHFEYGTDLWAEETGEETVFRALPSAQ